MKKTIFVDGPIFYAQGDETAFCSWLKQIKCIERVVGSGRNLEITIARETLGAADFREVVALFERYRLDKQPLRQFIRKDAGWAQNRNLYWCRDMFGYPRATRKQF